MVADEVTVHRRDGGCQFPSTAIPSAQYENPQILAERSAFRTKTDVPCHPAAGTHLPHAPSDDGVSPVPACLMWRVPPWTT